jgi:hypothetical protein
MDTFDAALTVFVGQAILIVWCFFEGRRRHG